MRPVFADTFYWIALTIPTDAAHERAGQFKHDIVTTDEVLGGLELYDARPDKGYSLIDCISMHTMRAEGLTEALTNDRHFEQEGFRALFRDS